MGSVNIVQKVLIYLANTKILCLLIIDENKVYRENMTNQHFSAVVSGKILSYMYYTTDMTIPGIFIGLSSELTSNNECYHISEFVLDYIPHTARLV